MENPFQNTQQVNAVIRVRRGPESDRLTNSYDVGELIYSTDKKRLFVGDGVEPNSTEGGVLVGNKVWITDNLLKLDQIQKYDLIYRTDNNFTGFYLLTGNNYQEDGSYLLLGGPKFLQQIGNFVLTPATRNNVGGVKVKEGLDVASDGSLSVSIDSDTMEIINNKLKVKNPYTGQNTGGGGTTSYASYVGYGIVRLSQTSGITVNNGVLGLNLDNRTIKLSSTIEGSKLYVDSSNINFPSLPKASHVTLGGIIIGDGLSANSSGLTNIIPATNSDFGGLILGDGLSANSTTGKVDVVGYNTGSYSVSSNGYTTLPGGIIMQWGYYTGSLDDTNATITLPITFPNKFLSVVSSPNVNGNVGDGGVLACHVYMTPSTLSSFKIFGSSNSTAPAGYFWQAIGY